MAQNNPEIQIGNERRLKSVLVMRFSAIGDVAMTIPVIYSACLTHPDVKFVMLTTSSKSGMFINRPDNLEVVGVDLTNQYGGVRGAYRLARDMMSKYGIDAFVDLHDTFNSKIMQITCRINGVKVAHINNGLKHKHALTRKTNKVMLPLVSSRARYREAFFKAGLSIGNQFKGLFDAGKKAEPSSFAAITGPKDATQVKWVGVAPFSAYSGKEYPLDKMQQVIRALSDRGDTRIFIFGGGGREEQIASQWAKDIPNVVSLAGQKHGFRAELSLLSHLDVMLTMDSANMHLAAITGTRTISIWGATHYYGGFRGWHQSDSDMIQLPLSCRPCSIFGDKKCLRGDLLCLTALRPEAVIQKIEEIIDKKTKNE